MDLTSAFATVVGLLAEYASERRSNSKREIEDFRDWLAEHRHNDIIKLIEQSDKTVIAIRALLSEERDQLNRRLEDIGLRLARLASANSSLAPLAAVLRPDATLSEQALEFLRGFVHSGLGRLIEVQPGIGESRIELVALDPYSGDGSIEYGDPRFYEDDLAALVDTGLIRLGHDPQGRILYLTRAGARIIEELDEATS